MIIAVVPARNSPAVEVTVAGLLGTGRVDRVVVVDDGSTDDTAARAAAAGATVLSLPTNWGKGGAVGRAVEQFPDASVYLLVDADLAHTAVHTVALLDPVLDGRADMAIAAFPPAGGLGGFGIVKRATRRVIASECGYEAREPLSGQRAVRGDLLRSLPPASRFGLEVAMTIDAVRLGARVVEVELPLDHAHTGRTLAGFRHRGGQAVDIARASIVRVGSGRTRRLVMVGVTLALLAAVAVAGRDSGGRPLHRAGGPVVLVTIADVSLADLDRGVLPNVSRLLGTTGGALTPRTPAAPGDQRSAYASLGAGAPVVLRNGTPTGARNAYGTLGALGDAAHAAGLRTAYVGARSGGAADDMPAALAIADRSGRIDTVSPGALPDTVGDAFDRRVGERVDAVSAAMDAADLVVVDAGGTPLRRPRWLGPASPASREVLHQQRLAHVRTADAFVGRIVAAHPDALVVVAGISPPSQWRLTPLAVAGDLPGALSSGSTRQAGLSALTDLAPTMLTALGVTPPATMIGQRLVAGPTPADPGAVRDLHLRTDARERLNPAITIGFIGLQALVYSFAVVGLVRRRRGGAGRRLNETLLAGAERIALACAAFPVVTFLYRLAPAAMQEPRWAAPGIALASVTAGVLASRARHHPLSPLVWIAGVTVAVMAVDAATAGALENVSLLGYSPLTAARYYGMGNMGFAVFGSAAILLAGAWMAGAPRRSEGVLAIACLLGLVTVLEVAPDRGADFGGALVFIPVFILAVVVWAGLRLTPGRLLRGALAAVIAIGAVAAVDAWSGGTHVSAFLGSGSDAMWATIERKIDANIAIFRSSTWTWMVPIITGFFAWSATLGGGWRRWFGGDRVWRTTFLTLLGFGVLGGLMNDSGIAIPAMVLVYAGAFVLLLERKQPFAPPVVTSGGPTATVVA
ncbi:MAG: glycosyltransferase [Acidimicrobiales bacterium]